MTTQQSIDIANTEPNADNPYIFTPMQQQLAAFNALSRKQMVMPPVKEAELALQYLQAPTGHRWDTLTTQSMVDAILFASDDVLTHIIDNIFDYPTTVADVVFATLENRIITEQLQQKLIATFKVLNEQSHALALQCLRSFSQGEEKALNRDIISEILKKPQLSPEMLQVIAGRHWHSLHESTMIVFLEHAAQVRTEHDPFAFFVGIFADIVQLPDCRDYALDAIRNEQRSDNLCHAIGILFNSAPQDQ